MVAQQQEFRLSFDRTGITVREPDDDDDDEKTPAPGMTVAEFNSAFSAREKKLLSKIDDRLATLGESSLTEESIDAMVTKLIGDDADPPPRRKKSNDDDDDGDDDSDFPAGYNARLEGIERELKSERKKRETAETASSEKDKKIVKQRRTHKLEQLLTAAKAVNPKQVSKLIFDDIIEDSEIGDAVTIMTDSGEEDVVSLESYIPRFKEDNTYLFEPEGGPRKAGSGAGGGASGKDKARTKVEDLRDPEDGGMDWDDYEKNRKQIHRDLERSRKGD